MNELFKSYFFSLANPIEYHSRLRQQREGVVFLKSMEELSYAEAILISWVFKIIEVIVALFMFAFFMQAVYSAALSDIPFMWDDLKKVKGLHLFIFFSFLKIIFFPFLAYVQIQISTFFMKLAGYILGRPLEQKEVDQVIVGSMSSHVFRIIPVFGDFAQIIASLILILIGLNKNLNLRMSQSVFIVLFPFLLLVAFFFFLIFMAIFLSQILLA